MNKTNLEKFTQVAGNAITDPGVLFGTGNAISMFAADNPNAGAANIATSALCFALRGASELKNANIPERLDHLTNNPGLAYATSGAIGLIGTSIEAINTDFNNPESILPIAAMTCFSSTGILRGIASGFDRGSVQQRTMDFAGVSTVVAGYTLANNNSPTTIMCSYFLALSMAGYLALKNKTAHSIFQPDLTFSATNLTTALSTESLPMAIANTFWSMGAASVHALKTRGGIFKETIKSKLSPQSYGSKTHYTALHGVDYEMDDIAPSIPETVLL